MAREKGRTLQNPQVFHRIEELPRNGSGKILKRVLAEQFGGSSN